MHAHLSLVDTNEWHERVLGLRIIERLCPTVDLSRETIRDVSNQLYAVMKKDRSLAVRIMGMLSLLTLSGHNRERFSPNKKHITEVYLNLEQCVSAAVKEKRRDLKEGLHTVFSYLIKEDKGLASLMADLALQHHKTRVQAQKGAKRLIKKIVGTPEEPKLKFEIRPPWKRDKRKPK